MTFDWDKIAESKRALRIRLAALPVAEKLRMLDALRERSVSIRPDLARKGRLPVEVLDSVDTEH